jgi:hypothetical protein
VNGAIKNTWNNPTTFHREKPLYPSISDFFAIMICSHFVDNHYKIIVRFEDEVTNKSILS